MNQSNFQIIFNQLRTFLKKHENELIVKTDSEATYYLDSERVFQKNNKPYFFGSVSIKKNYVSYYLMPVYVFPELLDHISPELKKRMQGKSCFNFKTNDEELFEELGELTDQSFERFKKEGMI
ncbi:hypothetical protein [Tenuibacillus multivorans]|uniref:YdhG-like domain-containing protein n=1 Tax=Tenuibacillus multivorans TaxID=237069 RepID=A0A1H0AYT2_9BACI|nr:hypothetical protein [Tenuibacillus multivorans]GEL77608.1 hypothetical protein TMU01_18430 [Tenuibacillus multivorans]SDN38578.1 hypothetical protein SAMN05216498_2140 [Tenuibacillus multivorans]